MIDLSEIQEAQIVRQCGLHANRIQDLHERLEMLMRQADNEAVCAYALSIAKSAQRIAQDAAYLATR